MSAMDPYGRLVRDTGPSGGVGMDRPLAVIERPDLRPLGMEVIEFALAEEEELLALED